jgi:hypothetical protein
VDLTLADQPSDFLFVRISKEGHGEAYALKQPKVGTRHAVVLVHGFGVDFGPISPSQPGNSWQTARDLFESDPDLSNYDIYMPMYWDDQSLVDSSLELGCFFRMLRKAHGKEAQIIVLGHSAGGLIVRHYTVSTSYVPGTVDRFLMLATPNGGSLASRLHLEPGKTPDNNMDGDGTASKELLEGSPFLNCLNNRSETPLVCAKTFLVNRSLQDHRGLNPNVPCAILAGNVKMGLVDSLKRIGKDVGDFLKKWLGKEAEDWVKEAVSAINKKILEKIPEGDILISLENQLIKGVPFDFLPYAHGFIHRPKDRSDKRYVLMKRFILHGERTSA